MNSVFSEQILGDKLSKLNNTQQCIETLSHWCIYHRKKAELVVQTWDKTFHSSRREQKVPFLYLANDILQNSKRNGTEFVEEFWKVLPAALKDVTENGDDREKNVLSRLVGIWEERRVFGSRAKGLKDLMLGTEELPALELNKKRSRSVRILKRDTRSIKIKLSIGGTAEKLVSAFHSVLSEGASEDVNLNNCKDSIRRVGKMEKDVALACAQDGDPRRTTLAEQLQEEEATLKQCIEKLKFVESAREALLSQLKEALQEQESQLENVRTQLQVAQARVEEAANMQRRLKNEPVAEPSSNGSGSASSAEKKKTASAIAAEVADKLAASTHSQQIMTSVLSTFAAEAKNASIAASTVLSSSDKAAKPDQPVATPASTAYIPILQQQPQPPPTPSPQPPPQAILLQHAPIPSNPSPAAAAAQQQAQYSLYPSPTPPPQFLQPSTGMMIGVPYGYTTAAIQPPPPAQPTQMVNMVRPVAAPVVAPSLPPQPPPMVFHQPVPFGQQLVPAVRPPYYGPLQPPGMAFFHPQSQ